MVFARITLRDGHIDRWEFHAPADELFNPPQFEYGSLVEVMPPHANTALAVPGPVLGVQHRHRAKPSCADAVLDACATLAERSGDPVVRIAAVLIELDADESGYPVDTVYKAIQRLTTDPNANESPTTVERLDRHRLMVSAAG
jgi:hypothetical protein